MKLLAVLFAATLLSAQTTTPKFASPEADQNQTWLNQVKKGLQGKEHQPAEQVFKNIVVLKGKEAGRLPGMMGALTGLLGVGCAHCHEPNQWDLETPQKKTTRSHFEMQGKLNKEYFNGENKITCFTCHRGKPKPDSI